MASHPIIQQGGLEMRILCRDRIGHFTVVCLVTWPCVGSEAGGDLVLIQASLFFICKCKLVSIRTA